MNHTCRLVYDSTPKCSICARPATMAEFMAQVQALEDAYADAAALDEQNEREHPVPDGWEDEHETLRRAALDRRGQP